MFGSFCYQRKDLKITIGTGSFININTDSQPLASADGTYPLVGWTLKNISTYLTEASCKDAGSLIQWALNMGKLINYYIYKKLLNPKWLLLKFHMWIYNILSFIISTCYTSGDNRNYYFVQILEQKKKYNWVHITYNTVLYSLN